MKYLIAASVFVSGFFIGIVVAWNPTEPTLTNLYKEYNHITMYEDGSFEGQAIDGRLVGGCIPDALCDK